MTRDEIAEINPEAIMYDGLDDAIIGMAERINFGPVVAYSMEKTIEILSNDMEVSDEDLDEVPENEEERLEMIGYKKQEMALEHYYYNVIGGYLGEYTPIFISTNYLELE
jgi:hypothetical protein